MRTRTLAQMRGDVRDRASIQGVGALARFPNATVDRYLNQALAELYDIVLDHSSGDDYITETTALSTASGVANVTLPTTFYRLKGVLAQAGSMWIPLRRFSLDEVGETGPGTAYTMRYRLSLGAAGTTPQLRLSPVPSGVIPLRVFFIQSAPVLVVDADLWDGFNGWEEYAVLSATLKVMQAQQNPATGLLESALDAERDRIASMAAAQDMGETDVVRVVEFSRDGYDVYPDPERRWV